MFVKVCGTTNEADALLAVALGADAIGFVFAPSPRQIAPVVAADIVRRLPPEILTVGVFRDESPDRIWDLARRVGFNAAQLHGHEAPADSRRVRERLPVTIKAFAAGDPAVAKAHTHGADMVMLDSPRPGSGQAFDWALVDGVADGTRLILAGGLNPSNVGDAIAMARPWGVDVATGVESAPGVKDPGLLREFIEAARRAGTQIEPRPVRPVDEADPDVDLLYNWADE